MRMKVSSKLSGQRTPQWTMIVVVTEGVTIGFAKDAAAGLKWWAFLPSFPSACLSVFAPALPELLWLPTVWRCPYIEIAFSTLDCSIVPTCGAWCSATAAKRGPLKQSWAEIQHSRDDEPLGVLMQMRNVRVNTRCHSLPYMGVRHIDLDRWERGFRVNTPRRWHQQSSRGSIPWEEKHDFHKKYLLPDFLVSKHVCLSYWRTTPKYIFELTPVLNVLLQHVFRTNQGEPIPT